MTMQQVKYFQATATYKSFSKAAESCFVAQTAVSKQIANLEKELDCTLLIRDKHHVSLTRSGEVFLKYATEILRLCEDAARDTKMAQLMSACHLRIGYWGILEQRMLIDLVKKYKKTNGSRNFVPVYSSVPLEEVVPSLLNRRQDAILMPTVIIRDIPRISYVPLVEPEIVLAVGRDHPLAGRGEVTIDELKTENFIAADTSASQPLNEFRESQWARLGFHPNIIFRATETESALLMTETGGGVMLVTDLMRYYEPKRLSFVTIRHFHMRQEMGIAWLTENTEAELMQFLEFVQKQEVSII